MADDSAIPPAQQTPDQEAPLRPANENPWYVLMTIWGEQDGEEINWDLHARNRDTWNRFWANEINANLNLTEDIDLVVTTILTGAERNKVVRQFQKLGVTPPDPHQTIDLSKTEFKFLFVANGLFFPFNVDFKEAAFQSSADFRKAKFQGEADFRVAKFQGDTAFRNVAFQVTATFSEAAFKGIAAFSDAAFKGNATFRNAAFQDTATFSKAAFKESAVFSDAAFQGNTTFLSAAFQGATDFSEAMFQGNTTFCKAAFQDTATFSEAEFKGSTDFRKAKYQDYGNFQKAAFQSSADFSEAEFQGNADFNETTFQGNADFGNAVFHSYADFENVRSNGGASFLNTALHGEADFREAVFRCNVTFNEAAFQGEAYFQEATFHGDADFLVASFQGTADFTKVTFQGYAIFLASALQGDAEFSEVTFQGDAYFSEAAFQGDTEFFQAVFEGKADFAGAARPSPSGPKNQELALVLTEHENPENRAAITGSLTEKKEVPKEARYTFYGIVSFRGAEFKGAVDFTNRRFGRPTFFTDAAFEAVPPLLSNAEMHPTTDWRGVIWPNRRDGIWYWVRGGCAVVLGKWFPALDPGEPYTQREIERQVDGYRQLRLRMNEIQDHEAEFDFFAKEQDAKRLEHRGRFRTIWKWALLSGYGLSSGYGMSVLKPALGLAGTILGGAWVLERFQGPYGPLPTWDMALGFSATNTIAFLGVRRELFPHVLQSLSGPLQVFCTVQSLFGAVFLFLLLLALRNRFRIR